MLNPVATARRAIPAVDRLLKHEAVAALIGEYGRPQVVATVRAALDEQRSLLGAEGSAVLDASALADLCARRLRAQAQASLRPVYNLTGTVLHTNLGRALLAPAAAAAVVTAMTRPVNLEFDVEDGARGERDSHVEAWLKRLTGAEAATVVNNNAAAVYLVLNTLAQRREVIVSRGELIEIGGAFRIPDIMARAGCKLREVGTTNRTHARDYAQAIGDRTSAVMKVHTSNYAIHGFTASVSEADLAVIAHERELPLLVDLGSGTLVDLERYGLPHEPTPRETIVNGADVVTFSGDKLLGGPQCGLIVGRADLIERIRRNPMKRALRVDKLILAALEATLRLYADPDRLTRELPTLRLLTREQSEIDALARRILPALVAAAGAHAEARVVACMSQIGSGSLPVDSLPSAGIALAPRLGRKRSAVEKLADAFRSLPVPVVGRIQDGALILDLRCLEDEAGFLEQLAQLSIPAHAPAPPAGTASENTSP